MTGSKLAPAATEESTVVDILRDYTVPRIASLREIVREKSRTWIAENTENGR